MSPSSDSQGRQLFPMLNEFFVESRFGIQVLLATLGFLLCASFFIYQAFEQQYQSIIEIFGIVDPKLKHELVFNDILLQNLTLLIGSIFAYIAAMIFLIIRNRHKYSGPLVTIKKFVEAMSQGNYAHRIVIRKRDEMQDLVISLNEMAEQLERRHGQVRDDRPENKASAS